MARCGNCGKASREGALFCQDCGQPLEARAVGGGGAGGPPVVPPASGAGGGLASAVAPVTVNDGRSTAPSEAVGSGVAAAPAVAAPAQAPVSPAIHVAHAPRTSCPQCHQPTPAGFAFCQFCGSRLGPSEPAPTVPRPERPPRRSSPEPVTRDPLPEPPAPRPAAARSGGASSSAAASGTLSGRLVHLRRDGSDGEVIALSGESFDIGRSEGGRTFSDDPYMAARHVRFHAQGGGVRVRALDNVNGVFLQIRTPYELQPGDVLYVGRELLRYEQLIGEERDPAPVVEHGVRLFGTTPRESWGRLRQISVAGTTRDIFHLCRAEVRLGREEGDIVFPDDEFMSRRHALLTRVGSKVRLEDLHSSNGTYVRLRGDRDLQPSDVLRVGDQVLRFEP